MKYLSFLIALTFLAFPTYASEITGSLSTGVSTGIEGVLVSAPTATPVAGTYTSAQNITLNSSGGALRIHYTTDGTIPTCSGGTLFSSAISVPESLTIRAISCYPNNVESGVGVFAYGINIPSAPSGGGGGGGGGGGIFPNPPTTGDINNDGKVDLTDFNLLIVSWGSTGSGLPADLNNDGVVDLLDFVLLLANWTN